MTLREIAVRIDEASEYLTTLVIDLTEAGMPRTAMRVERCFCQIQRALEELRRRDEAGPDAAVAVVAPLMERWVVEDEPPVPGDDQAPAQVGLFEEVTV